MTIIFSLVEGQMTNVLTSHGRMRDQMFSLMLEEKTRAELQFDEVLQFADVHSRERYQV